MLLKAKQSLFLLIIFLLIIFFGCIKAKKAPETMKQGFFDAENYFSNEITILDSIELNVTKTASINSKKETTKIENETIDWDEELKQFKSLQINRPTLWDKYIVDTFFSEKGTEIRYSTDDRSLKIRQLTIYMNNDNKIIMVKAQSRVKNFLQESLKQWEYKRMEGYNVSGQNNLLFMDTSKYSLKVVFEKHIRN